MNNEQIESIVSVLRKGGLAVFKSDTLYGIHAVADNPEAVEKIYSAKHRDEKKPFIILINGIEQAYQYNVAVNKSAQKIISAYWPGKLTVVLKSDLPENKKHLNKYGNTLAFRHPKDETLNKIIEQTGPLVSTTVNISGEPPINNIESARDLFGDKIDLYVDSGKACSEPTTIADCSEEPIKILREGAVKIDHLQPETKKPSAKNVQYNNSMKQKLNYGIAFLIFLLIGAGVYVNVQQQKSIDHSKIPAKVEESNGFQRWITNLKNKGLNIEADEFKLKEENEIYNTKWMQVYSVEEEGRKEEYESYIGSLKGVKNVAFSPSGREFIDYRAEYRDGYAPNEAHFYGLKEDKIIDARILDCSTRANCFFDRAFFLDNDVFVISEVSRNIDKKDETAKACSLDEKCTYSIKLHVIDLINNKRLVYESNSFESVMKELAPEL